MNEKLENVFKHHPPKEGQAEKYETIRKHAKVFAYLLDELCPDSEEKDQALINLQQVSFWANASIARNEGRFTDIFKPKRDNLSCFYNEVKAKSESDIEKIANEIIKRLEKE